MKLIMVLGGLIGFGIGLASALAGGPGGLQAGGLWRAAYAPRSVLGVAAVLGMFESRA